MTIQYLSLYVDPVLRVQYFLHSCTLLLVGGWTHSGMLLICDTKLKALVYSDLQILSYTAHSPVVHGHH